MPTHRGTPTPRTNSGATAELQESPRTSGTRGRLPPLLLAQVSHSEGKRGGALQTLQTALNLQLPGRSPGSLSGRLSSVFPCNFSPRAPPIQPSNRDSRAIRSPPHSPTDPVRRSPRSLPASQFSPILQEHHHFRSREPPRQKHQSFHYSVHARHRDAD